jgi:hypothetical protein
MLRSFVCEVNFLEYLGAVELHNKALSQGIQILEEMRLSVNGQVDQVTKERPACFKLHRIVLVFHLESRHFSSFFLSFQQETKKKEEKRRRRKKKKKKEKKRKKKERRRRKKEIKYTVNEVPSSLLSTVTGYVWPTAVMYSSCLLT